MDGTNKSVDEAWATYLAFPTLENARAYDEAKEQAETDVSRETVKRSEWHGICLTCGPKFGRTSPREYIMTTSLGHCDWCGKDDVSVASPRDYGYPERPALPGA
jgi:hypothetical protein